jgi:CTP-dependent riboflavin kinase
MTNEVPNYSVTLRTNSIGEIMIDLTVNSDSIETIKQKVPELYNDIGTALSADGYKIADYNEQNLEIDTTAKEVPILKVTGKGEEVLETYKNAREFLKKEVSV